MGCEVWSFAGKEWSWHPIPGPQGGRATAFPEGYSALHGGYRSRRAAWGGRCLCSHPKAHLPDASPNASLHILAEMLMKHPYFKAIITSPMFMHMWLFTECLKELSWREAGSSSQPDALPDIEGQEGQSQRGQGSPVCHPLHCVCQSVLPPLSSCGPTPDGVALVPCHQVHGVLVSCPSSGLHEDWDKVPPVDVCRRWVNECGRRIKHNPALVLVWTAELALKPVCQLFNEALLTLTDSPHPARSPRRAPGSPHKALSSPLTDLLWTPVKVTVLNTAEPECWAEVPWPAWPPTNVCS